jgi:hypothetical protein
MFMKHLQETDAGQLIAGARFGVCLLVTTTTNGQIYQG